MPLDALPLVVQGSCRDLLGIEPVVRTRPSTRRSKAVRGAPGPTGPVRNDHGEVVDGRDAWLSTVAFHVLHDAIEAGKPLDLEALAMEAWARFAASTALGRPRKNGSLRYGPPDALRKVEDKLRLHRDGRLPPRGEVVEARHQAPTLSVDEARDALDRMLGGACRAFEDWHETRDGPAPQIGIRATVGLGKSRRARSHVLALRERLRQAERASRIVLLTPSHALAEEAAQGWRTSGLQVAV